MGVKSVLEPDYAQINKFELDLSGIPPLTLLSIGALEEELDNPDLPDRTTHTGGRTKPVEFDIKIAMHHKLERAAMEEWFALCKDPIDPNHKRTGTLIIFSQSRLKQISYTILGAFPQKRGLPELDLDNDGELAVITWTMKADEVLPQE